MLRCAPPAPRPPGLGTSTCFSAAVEAWHARVRTHQPGSSTSPLHMGARAAPPRAHGVLITSLPSHTAVLAAPFPRITTCALLPSHPPSRLLHSHPAHSVLPSKPHASPHPQRLQPPPSAHPDPPKPAHRPARQQEGAAPRAAPLRPAPFGPAPPGGSEAGWEERL